MNIAKKISTKLTGQVPGNGGSSEYRHPDDGFTEEEDPDFTETLGDEPRSILLGIVSQLRKGMDLSRVTLPVFVLEPRSGLEKLTDFMSSVELILRVADEPDPNIRFIRIVKFYLSGWHIKPKGVKKPYNPVLGEFFRCKYEYPSGTGQSTLQPDPVCGNKPVNVPKSTGYYIAEQVSHHPPKSVFFYTNPQAHFYINGAWYPRSKFLGNSAATIMNGGNDIVLQDIDEHYRISMPNMYARGILFGKMLIEIGDEARVSCAKSGLVCDIEFKVKGYFTGSYNSMGATIKNEKTGEKLYELYGKWTDIIYIKDLKTGKEDILIDTRQSPVSTKIVAAEDEQERNESRRLWQKVTAAMQSRNFDLATEEKSTVEDAQRRETQQRAAEGVEWRPRFFVSLSGFHAKHQPAVKHFVDGEEGGAKLMSDLGEKYMQEYVVKCGPTLDWNQPEQCEKALESFIFSRNDDYSRGHTTTQPADPKVTGQPVQPTPTASAPAPAPAPPTAPTT